MAGAFFFGHPLADLLLVGQDWPQSQAFPDDQGVTDRSAGSTLPLGGG